MVMIVMNDDDDDRVVPERALSIRLLEVSGWFAELQKRADPADQ